MSRSSPTSSTALGTRKELLWVVDDVIRAAREAIRKTYIPVPMPEPCLNMVTVLLIRSTEATKLAKIASPLSDLENEANMINPAREINDPKITDNNPLNIMYPPPPE